MVTMGLGKGPSTIALVTMGLGGTTGAPPPPAVYEGTPSNITTIIQSIAGPSSMKP